MCIRDRSGKSELRMSRPKQDSFSRSIGHKVSYCNVDRPHRHKNDKSLNRIDPNCNRKCSKHHDKKDSIGGPKDQRKKRRRFSDCLFQVICLLYTSTKRFFYSDALCLFYSGYSFSCELSHTYVTVSYTHPSLNLLTN